MTRRTLVATAATTLAAAAAAVPALTAAQATSGTSLTVHAQIRSVTIDHRGARVKGTALKTGDAVLTRQALTDDVGTAIGTLYTHCTNVGSKAPLFKATMSCIVHYDLTDGQITASGILDRSSTLAIIGGTKAHSGASGDVTVGEKEQAGKTTDVLHLG